MLDVLLLGTGGMIPLPERWLSAALVRCRGELTLFDCGEGTQIVWRTLGWGFRRVGAICLSHCHADHVAGLPGLLLAMAQADRIEPVALYGPTGTAAVVAGLRTIAPTLPFDLRVTELSGGERFPLPGGLAGRVIAGRHRVPCLVYRVDADRAPRFLPEQAERLGVPRALWRPLQRGEAVTVDGRVVAPEQVLGPPRRGLAAAYVTDTRSRPAFAPFLSGVDLLVCEGTYGDPRDQPKAAAWGHLTFGEAARLARAAAARRLWLTHFSPAMAAPEDFLGEATSIFPETTIGFSGLTISLAFDEDA